MRNSYLVLNPYRIATLMNHGYVKSEKRLRVGDCISIAISNDEQNINYRRIFDAEVTGIEKTRMFRNGCHVKKIWLKALLFTLRSGSKRA